MFRNAVRSAVTILCALLFSLTLFGCGSSGGGSNSTGTGSTGSAVPTLLSIAVTPPSPTLGQNVSQQFTATGTYSDGGTKNLTALVVWHSANASVATINPSTGLAQTLAPGTTSISATSGTVSGTATLKVTAATLTSISIAPASSATITGVGNTQQFTATGRYSDLTQQDITTSVTWSSTSGTIATISNDPSAQGLVTAVAVGSTAISATSGGIVSPSTALTVAPLPLDHITITTPFGTIAKGYRAQFTATAFYVGNARAPEDVTTKTTFTSSSTGIATISNDLATAGLALGVSAGTTNITGTYQGKSDVVNLSVNSDILNSVAVTSADSNPLAKGLFRQLTATGTFFKPVVGADGKTTYVAGGITQDVTNDVQWTATDPSPLPAGCTGPVVQVSNANSSTTVRKGLIYANTGCGTSNIVATGVKPVTTTSGEIIPGTGIGGTTTTTNSPVPSPVFVVTVAPPVVTQLQISPPATSIPAGVLNTKQYKATAIYSDATSKDVTAATAVTWNSDSAAASISNALATKGLATAGNAAGVANITAVYAPSPASSVAPVAAAQLSVTSAKSVLTITAATLDSISTTIPTPLPAQIAKGTTQAIKATGTYSNGTTQDLTKSVTWTSTNLGVATISNAAGSNGLITGIDTGDTILVATDPATGKHSDDTVVNLHVSAATISSVAVTPATVPAALAVGTTQQFKATGTFGTGLTAFTEDLTGNNVTWTSSNTANVSISSSGLATAKAPDNASIKASFGGVDSNLVLVKVKPAGVTLTSVAIDQSGASLAANTTANFTATGTYSDMTTSDLTNQVTWTSSDDGIVTVDGTGLVTAGVVAGTAKIKATFTAPDSPPLVSPTVTVTVTTAVLNSLTITPPSPSVVSGATKQLTAKGTFSDTTTQDLSADAALTWKSSAVGVATISPKGLVTGVATTTSTTIISATYANPDGTTKTSHVTLTVTPAPAPAAP